MDSGPSLLDALCALPLFAGIDVADLVSLARHTSLRIYGPGEEIIGEEAAITGIFLIVQGRARVYRSSAEGDEFVVNDLVAGDTFGLSLLFPDAHSQSGLQAGETGTQAIWVPQQAFTQWALAHSDVLLRSMQLLGREYELLSERSADLALYSVRKRLARDVLRQIEAYGVLEVTATQEQLAARIGTKGAEIARSVGELKRRRVVESTRGRRGLLVLDLEELEALAEDQ